MDFKHAKVRASYCYSAIVQVPYCAQVLFKNFHCMSRRHPHLDSLEK
jgi:hypothetical protein